MMMKIVAMIVSVRYGGEKDLQTVVVYVVDVVVARS